MGGAVRVDVAVTVVVGAAVDLAGGVVVTAAVGVDVDRAGLGLTVAVGIPLSPGSPSMPVLDDVGANVKSPVPARPVSTGLIVRTSVPRPVGEGVVFLVSFVSLLLVGGMVSCGVPGVGNVTRQRLVGGKANRLNYAAERAFRPEPSKHSWRFPTASKLQSIP